MYYTSELMFQLTANAGKVIDANDWFSYYGFDVMGDLTFGKSFSALRTGTRPPVLKLLHRSIKAVTLLGTAPWTAQIIQSLPVARGRVANWLKWCEQQVGERKKVLVI
jgi:hypothetical protein